MTSAPRRDDAPRFLIIGGPNGSGKSSAYRKSVAETDGHAFLIINPDLFAARIAEAEALPLPAANLQAVQRIEAWLETSILAGHTIGVETVLSTGKYRRLVTKAKALGYIFHFVYVLLEDPLLNIERVGIRVKRGGHAVPEDKIKERYWKSLEQMTWFLEQADQALIYDNSGAMPRRIGMKQGRRIEIDPDAPAVLVERLRTMVAPAPST